ARRRPAVDRSGESDARSRHSGFRVRARAAPLSTCRRSWGRPLFFGSGRDRGSCRSGIGDPERTGYRSPQGPDPHWRGDAGGRVTTPAIDNDPRRWRMLGILAIAELLGMSLWFGARAVASELGARWSLDTSQIGWLTSVVQLGFVVGTALAALLNIADIVPARWYFAAAAAAGGLANLGLLAVDHYGGALVLRFATGLFLAGVYPPAMKMASTWFRAQRGLAIGTVVGALVVGKSTPYLVHAIPSAGSNAVILTASGCALLAALLIAVGYQDGPYPFPPRPFSWGLVGTVVQGREWRLATGGYLGHMFELYSFWTWIPLFIAARVAAEGVQPGKGTDSVVSLIAFGTIAIGGFGCIWGGLSADRRGRERLV